ncbi:class I adenylate-forming enzyme family protein [Promethearchaeum syntrophicum]|uniref:Class I adenylate-forming enzyme family protein n=1 Tax=Promethearchaeum syntrophicum TaxID=2594042 RepID=A0A5B9DH38_9ARCH|nr:class I adenylate-forming enzyme family protein [Candidatus Prometheoarchaeum syntrophicum]QEE18053.1 3-hydroxypropionyl-coenzyme A synthetase [Candidatus Prometheoarchaeum syntrophicum]
MNIILNSEQDEQCKQLYKALDQNPLVFNWLDHWAKEMPDKTAIIEYNTEKKVSWKEFSEMSKIIAAKLISKGVKKGDVIATSLPFLKEHAYLMQACARIGAIITPLDLRLKINELDRCFSIISPKAYFTVGKTEIADFRPNIEALIKKYSKKNGGPCEIFIQFQREPDLIVDNAIGFGDFMQHQEFDLKSLDDFQKQVTKRDPIVMLFTTGSTGYPKPALISSEGILIQSIGFKVAWKGAKSDVMLVNLPPSHAGGTIIQHMTMLYLGGISCLLHMFNPVQSLDAIQKYKVSILGMVPAMYSIMWQIPNYKEYDVSSLRWALSVGQTATKEFLSQLKLFSPIFGSGYGITEMSGVPVYCKLSNSVDEVYGKIGYKSPLCPLSIRKEMNEDGSAGLELSGGEIGHICFSGSQVFLGYLNDEEKTRRTISTDGFCYTGDLGSYDENGLHLSGRAKNVIKPKGYQVFPAEIEDFIQNKFKEKIMMVGVVGAPHKIFSEGIIAFVAKNPKTELNVEEIKQILPEIASYKRPLHFEIIEPGEMPLNRTKKVDYVELRKRGLKISETLRSNGKWDVN